MSVSITKKPLLPVVTLQKDDASLYTFNHFTGTYGFRIRSLNCIPPKDNQKGDFTIQLTSSTASNTDTNTLLNNISLGNEVSIYVGKTDAGKELIFLGKIETLEIRELNKNYMDVYISGPDWGSDLLKSRIINGQWAQDKDTDGETILSTDTHTTIQNIVLDMLTETSSYASGDYTAEDQGLSVSSLNIKTPEIQLSAFVANYERLDDKLTELDTLGGTFHWVSPDKVFHMEIPDTSSSSRPAEILITDDYTNATALLWDQTKVGLIGTDSLYKTTVENRKSRLYGIGGDLEEIDKSSETVTGSTSLYNQYVGLKITPTKRFLEGVSLYVSKTGTPPTTSLTLLITEDNNGQPTGDILRSVKLDSSLVSATGSWATWKCQVELNTAKSYWLVLQLNPGDDSSNHYNWFRNGGTASTTASSTDGTNWTVNTSGFTYSHRTYITRPLISINSTNEGITTSKHYHEEVISKPDITIANVMWKLLQGESLTAFKQKEIIKCRIYAPDTLLKSGQKIRVVKTASGKSINSGTDGYGDFVLGEVEYDFDSNNNGTGTFWYDAELVRFIPYA